MSPKVWIPILVVIALIMVGIVFLLPGPAVDPVIEPPSKPVIENPKQTPVETTPSPAAKETTRLTVEVSLSKAAPAVPKKGQPIHGMGRNSSLTGSVSGRSGEPLPGTTLRFVAGMNQGLETTADEAGKFRFPSLYPGLNQLEISCSIGTLLREVRLAPGGADQKDFNYGLQSTVAGRIVNREGKPIDGANVQIDQFEGWSDADGKFYIQGVFPGDVVMYVKASGFAYFRQNVYVSPNYIMDPSKLQVVLSPGGDLSGGVYPVGGPEPALLYLLPNHSTYDRTFPVEKYSAISISSGGSFTLRNVPFDVSMGLFAFHPRSAAKPQMKPIHLRSNGENIMALDFRFVSIRSLQAEVRDGSTGAPVPNARVRVFVPNPYASVSQILRIAGPGMGSFVLPMLPAVYKEVSTDGNGYFLVETGDADIPTSPITIVVEAEGLMPYEKTFSGAEIPKQNIVLYPPNALMTKSVLALRFQPNQSVEISLKLNGSPKELIKVEAGSVFQIPELTTGIYSVEVRDDSRVLFKEESLPISNNRELNIVISQ